MAKSKWEQVKDKLTLVEGWARDGLTDIQIAEKLGISKDTFYEYKKKYSDFSDSLKKGKEIVDYEVENALLKKALGYTITLKKEKVTKDGNVVEIKEEVLVPPDTTAQIFWLKNRKPKEWRETQEVAVSTDTPNPFKGLSTEELRQLIKNDK